MTIRSPAISARGLSKSYKLYSRPVDRLYELLSRKERCTIRHSLQNVTFDVQHGEVIGVIGANGAGKSTLLKIIASRLEPTTGSVTVDGSVVAILELGTGFHPDFTGRQNVYLGGLCLGLSRREIDRQIDNIIGFSELEEVIDMPFRIYSTGMQARLTFATAVAVNPDIFIIDEALSVGDNRFQLKSFNRIRSFKEAGKTILLVTHSMSSITTFCDRAILLHRGKIIADGEPNWVTNVYHNLQFGDLAIERLLAERDAKNNETIGEAVVAAEATIDSHPAEAVHIVESGPTSHSPFIVASPKVFSPMAVDLKEIERGVNQGYRYGNRTAAIAKVVILDEEGGGPIVQLTTGKRYQFLMDCEVYQPLDELFLGFLVRDPKGETLFGIDSRICQPPRHQLLLNVRQGVRIRAVLKVRMWLSNGTYFVSGALAEGNEVKADMWLDAYEFHVTGTEKTHTTSRVNLQPEFSLFPL